MLDNITVAPRKVKGEPRAEVHARAMSLLERVGLAGLAGQHPARLSRDSSSAWRSRARSRCAQGDALRRADSALDPELVGEVLDVMRGLAQDSMTMLVVTHEIGLAREVADRLVLLDGGVVVEQGRPREVIADPQHPRTRALLASVLP